tara:strand:+ start:976 stop:1749 length:774 start_codon:yes stop_codon:yes gene_type:complete
MKAVILAGGLGTRISEESQFKPKPMIEIGGKPILWHILKIYSFYGINDFIICCGYKGYLIKEYFSNYFLHTSDVTFDFKDNTTKVHHQNTEPWKITLVDTGEITMTGGRLLKVKSYLMNENSFCFTYGDGLSDVNINKLIDFHNNNGLCATLTAVQPPGRFGSIAYERGKVLAFNEKPKGDGSWINGGFFVLTPEVFNYIDGDETIWEEKPLQKLSEDSQLGAYHHEGFWQPMDTLRDKNQLEDLWNKRQAPWKIWK